MKGFFHSASNSKRGRRKFNSVLKGGSWAVKSKKEVQFSLTTASNNDKETMLPDPCELLNVTNRRKAPLKKKYAHVDKDELQELQTTYEELLLKSETESIIYEVQLDYLTRKLNEGSIISLRESEAVLSIKHLEDQVMELEQEKSLSQQNLNDVYELAMQQNMHAKGEYEECYG